MEVLKAIRKATKDAVIETSMACVRCGACCILGTCSYGEEAEDGYCRFLIIHKDLTTSCKTVHRLKHIIGAGCFLRSNEDLWQAYMEMVDVVAVKKEIRESR